MSTTNTLHVIVWILNGETDCYSTPNAEGARTIADAYHRAGAMVYWQKLYGAPHAVVSSVGQPRQPVLPIPDPHLDEAAKLKEAGVEFFCTCGKTLQLRPPDHDPDCPAYCPF